MDNWRPGDAAAAKMTARPTERFGTDGGLLNGGTLTRDALIAAGIAQTDISASNGIIHVINHVLRP
jgi:uncharacterized surface protein with fasciclin (FAS1) repeats